MKLRHATAHQLMKCAVVLAARTCIVLAIAASMIAAPADFVATQAMALPAGWFHLRGTVHDNSGGGALRAIDVWDKSMKVTNFIQLSTTLFARDSQLWKERFIQNGSIDRIKLENKLTGLCLGDAVRPTTSGLAVPSLLACTDPDVIWQKISLTGNRVIFVKTTRLAGFFSDIHVCLAKGGPHPELLALNTCDPEHPRPEEIWEAYVSG